MKSLDTVRSLLRALCPVISSWLTQIFVLFWVTQAGASSPITLTYQGRLTNGSGTAISDSTVALKFRILNDAGDCILYSETQTVDTSSSSGVLSVEIGSATGSGKRNTEDRNNSMADIFSNNGTAIPGKQLAAPASNCATDYSPATNDSRKLQIIVLSTSTQPALNLTLTPMQSISSVPYATVAQTLNGYTSSQFLRLQGSAAAPTARVTSGNVNTLMDRLFTTQASGYDRLDDMLTNWGTNISISSNNFNLNSNKIINLATPTTGTDAANKNYCDGYVGGQATSGLGSLAGGDNGKALVWNGTNWVAQAINSLPIQTGNSGKYLTTDGTSASWSTISTLPTQTGNSGKFLTTDGTSASWATAGTVTTATATAPLEISGTASSAPNVRFVAGTALNDSYVLTVTNGNQPSFVNPAGLYILKGGQTGALSLGTTDATNLTILTNNSARVTVDSTGLVGIGTASPSAKLDISSGQLRVAPYDAGTAVAIDWNNGNMQYTAPAGGACTAMTFTNLLDGGSYTLAVKGVTSGTCTFSQAGLTFVFSPVNSAVGTDALYTFLRMDSTVYVSWITGFQ